jgi:hypothetical protein
MVTAVVISVLVMMQFAVPVGFCKQASFYSDSWPCVFDLIGMMLLTESAHLSNALSFLAVM